MSKGVELEQAIIDAIERILTSDEDVEIAKTYLSNVLVNDMIEESQED